MSLLPFAEPECKQQGDAIVELEIRAQARDLGGGLGVRRLLPSAARRMVGPFIFVDHMGPVRFDPGRGIDVRPHPHINLATVTFLFEGEILHRDNLGSEQAIRPGAVNWMIAGSGIVHSERTPALERKTGATAHGMQLWVALPRPVEEMAPSFEHHPPGTIPLVERPGARLRVIAGAAYGAASPARVLSPLFYVEAQLERDASLELPDDHAERAVYVVAGALQMGGKEFGQGTMFVCREGAPASVRALVDTRALLLGGAPLDGPRHIWWNFVSSSPDRIERAKEDWRHGRFSKVPGDEAEFIPLPET
jgi:redox-sensitive bicupin YhaK (pirin superfamily)